MILTACISTVDFDPTSRELPVVDPYSPGDQSSDVLIRLAQDEVADYERLHVGTHEAAVSALAFTRWVRCAALKLVLTRTEQTRPSLESGTELVVARIGTVLSKIIRALVDPNPAPVRTAPREERDLFIASNNSHLLDL